jgi:hypothetical protein
MTRFRTFVLVVTPLVAVLVLVLGLRVGAKGAVRAATVYGAPPAKGSTVVAWQVVTFLDDRGVREATAMKGLEVTATTKSGKKASFRGDTNVDGVLEVALDVLDRSPPPGGEELHLVVTGPGESLPLAEGDVRVPEGPFGSGEDSTRATPVRATKRTGSLEVELFVADQVLVVGAEVQAVVRVRDANGKTIEGAELTVVPEPGVDAKGFSRTCADGFGFGELYALFHTTGLTVNAKTADGREGSLFAALPVAHGATPVEAPREVRERESFAATVRAPGTRNVAYAEVDDAYGRVFALPLDLLPDARGPKATFTVPGLPAGNYWLVTSGDPRGAEKIEGSTVARYFRVGKHVEDTQACAARADLAMHPGRGFVRSELLDGLESRRRDDTKREHLGLGMALVGLLAAAVIETLLALQAVREARETIEGAVREAEGEAAAQKMTKRASAGSVAVGIAIVVLGFALLAVLLVWKA